MVLALLMRVRRAWRRTISFSKSKTGVGACSAGAIETRDCREEVEHAGEEEEDRD